MKLYLTMNGKDYELNISAREETATQSIAMSDSETENLLKEAATYLREKAMFNVDHALAMANGKIQRQDLSVASSCLHDLLGDLHYIALVHPL